jgi:predicted transcriptional regulator
MRELEMRPHDLAEIIGMPDATVSRWISGQRTPQLYNAISTLKALGLVDIKVKDLL